MTTTINTPPQAFRTAGERAFAADMLAYYRRAGDRAAWKLVKRMADASDAGCFQEDHRKMVREALAALPTRH